MKNKKFHQLLEYVLAIGNYSNKGSRGNAYGFKLSSLSKLSDTKSKKIINENNPNSHRQINLCHYIVETLTQFYQSKKLALENSNTTIIDSSGLDKYDILSIVETESSFFEVINSVAGLTFSDCGKEFNELNKSHSLLQRELKYLTDKFEKGLIIPNDDFLLKIG